MSKTCRFSTPVAIPVVSAAWQCSQFVTAWPSILSGLATVAEQKAAGFKHTTISRDQTVDGYDFCIETRIPTVIHDVAWLQDVTTGPA